MFIDSVSAKRAARICGYESVAMLDYLQRSGIYVPRNSQRGRRGKGRRYEFRDLMVLRTISVILSSGASVSALKTALLEFQTARWEADRASLQYDGQVFKYFVVEGKRIHFVRSNKTLFDMTSGGQMSFGFIVDFDGVHAHVINGLQQRELSFVTG